MKLVTFEYHAARKLGMVNPDHKIVDITAIVGSSDMNVLIAGYSRYEQDIKRISQEPRAAALAINDVRLLAPIPATRRNIFCVGKNYYAHAQEFGNSGYDSSAAAGNVPKFPIIFTKPATAICGPGDGIDSSLDPFDTIDYEAELAVVLGAKGRVTDADDPMSFVFGYTLVNDVTSRHLQKIHSQWVLGKGLDGFCPMGPVLVTADEFGAPGLRTITCEVNGELRQKASLADLIFDIPTLIKTIGAGITLLPGDVIATGTPAGVGLGFNPPRYLQKGDVVKVAMDGVGDLVNSVY